MVIVNTYAAFSQTDKPSPGILAGIGNYEYLHAGMNIPVGKRSYLETALGLKPWNISSETYAMIYVQFGVPMLKKSAGARFIEPHLQAKAVTWYFDNEFNTFAMLGIGPEVRLTHYLNSSFQLAANGGIIYNTNLHYERKTNEEVGWPKEWQPSFSIQVCYRIKKVP